MGGETYGDSPDERDEDDDDYEDANGGNRFLGFMFGNVDNSGDLDADYLDEDAKEHLAALADKLGPTLTDIDLSTKSPKIRSDAVEPDYDAKAEDAIDYEDIDEEYDGPEIEATGEEDHLLPKREYFSAEVSLATLEPTASVFDDEDYDEDFEKVPDVVNGNAEAQNIHASDEQGECLEIVSEGEKSFAVDDLQSAPLNNEVITSDAEGLLEGTPEVQKRLQDEKSHTPLPVLCMENGMAILQFSEIFGVHDSLNKKEKRDSRYSTRRDKYRSADVSDIVEEDEEAFLHGFSRGVSYVKPAYVVKDDTTMFDVDDPEYTKFGVVQGVDVMASRVDWRQKDRCCGAEPMKQIVAENVTIGSNSLLFKKFYPLDHQNWEERILWDNSPVSSKNASGSCEASGSDIEASSNSDVEPQVSIQIVRSEDRIGPNGEGQSLYHHGFQLLEPFGSRKISGTEESVSPEMIYHPQMLRLESWKDVDDSCQSDGIKESISDEHQSYAVRSFSKFSPKNRRMLEGSWLDKVLWETDEPIEKPKFIFDLEDEHMLFEISDENESKYIQFHSGAMILTRSSMSINGNSFEISGSGGQGGWRVVSNDKHYSNRKASQQLKSNSKKRSVHGIKVFHSKPAMMLQTMKLKLSNKELANFHRPKALWYPHDNEVTVRELQKLPTQGQMKIIMKSLGGKGSKHIVDPEETVSSIMAKASKKLDMKPSENIKLFYSGKELEREKSLAAQNVKPNSLLHLVRSKIYIMPRAQNLRGENRSVRSPGAFKKKSDLSVKDGHVFLMEYCEERPLLLGNIGMGARLCTYYQKSSPDDQTGALLRNGGDSLGHVIILEPSDKSPYLGDLKGGSIQASLETNMYRSPVFSHKVPMTDYILVRSAKGKLSLRRIDKNFAVGQQEPLMEVFSPGTKSLQTFMMNRLTLYMFREFLAAEKRRRIPDIRVEELPSQFPYLSETIIRKKLKEYALQQRNSSGQIILIKKRNASISLKKDAVTPEDVCKYESMQAGLYRLKHLGLSEVHPSAISSAMSRLPDEAITLAAASHIERELQITPWNLSSNFVACTTQGKENIERLEITGVGDPSGRGLGFSYVRSVPKAPISNASLKKKAASSRGSSAVTGTDADLRRLSMDAAKEVLLKFDVSEEQIAKLTRWHRIAMIRRLSSEQAASGVQVDPTTISKYARGQRMSFLQLQRQTREKCQEIWERQIQSLSASDGAENESDSEGNSDLDSFAGDLENLLDAEEFEDEVDTFEIRHEKTDGVKGLKMRRRPSIAQTEEEIEDEVAEAAELCRLLMDDEAERRRKKKKNKVMGEAVLSTGFQASFGHENPEQTRHLVSIAQPDVTYISKENIREQKEVENIINRKEKFGKLKPTKKNYSSEMNLINKKLKISGDKVKNFKEKKSARESFVCGKCGQFGHMRTNKNCPKYGEDLETPETTDQEKVSIKLNTLDPSNQSHQKAVTKKVTPKAVAKSSTTEAFEGEKSTLMAKVFPVKFKCSSSDRLSDNLSPALPQTSDLPVNSDNETGKSVKVNKITFSKKRTEDIQFESHKPSIVIRPPDAKKVSLEAHKPSIVIRPPTNMDRDKMEFSRRSATIIRSAAETEKEQLHKKLIIKRPKEVKEVIDLDRSAYDGSVGMEYRKTKRIVELSSFEKHTRHGSMSSSESGKKKVREEHRWWEKQEKQRNEERLREEKVRRVYNEQMGMREEQEKLAEIRRFEASIRSDKEEEERLKAKKKKKKRIPEILDDYMEDPRSRRFDKRVLEKERSGKRKPIELGRHVAEHASSTKRRRGGEVGLSNILERIVETLKDRFDISYLFLKPVSKKEAPDYLDIIERPMDLSTIREKVRRLEYKTRDEFRNDVWQIMYNAHLYNDGRNPGIPPLADKLLMLCDNLLKHSDEELTEAEIGIEYRDS
ncbi:transcription initiation factor TFIID subunit 1 isoform X2 [Benincasa hispida]|uniref:transcription initiation factor TFIID subunit 1 isoform X2 n=1 Tax=Benincasa hispida TaxID=102211 RepID=UPI001901E7DD|nr:transcription initiation factor TFIID subunit 1 isoform X2 [Benincasa hispida]